MCFPSDMGPIGPSPNCRQPLHPVLLPLLLLLHIRTHSIPARALPCRTMPLHYSNPPLAILRARRRFLLIGISHNDCLPRRPMNCIQARSHPRRGTDPSIPASRQPCAHQPGDQMMAGEGLSDGRGASGLSHRDGAESMALGSGRDWIGSDRIGSDWIGWERWSVV